MNLYHNLLRPKSELAGAGVSAFLAATTFALQDFMLFTPQIGQSMAVLFAVTSALRTRAGFKLYRYHRNLSSTQPFTIKSEKLYKSQSVYYVGQGFEWTAEHTKRITDLYQRRNLGFLHASRREKKLKNWALVHKHSTIGKLLHRYFSSYHILNPYPPRNATGTSAIHGIGTWEGEESVYFDIDISKHMAIYGGTGSGKTTTMLSFITQDIDAGRPTIVIDPKGGFKVFAAMWDAAKRNDKIGQFRIIHLAFPEHSCQCNPVGTYHRITEVSGRLAEGIDSEEAYKSFAWLKSNFIAMGCHYLGIQPSFDKIKYYMTRCDELVENYCRAYIERHAASFDKAQAVIDLQLSTIKTMSLDGNAYGHAKATVAIVRAVEQLIENQWVPDHPQLRTMMSYVHENIVHERKLIRNIEPILEKLTTGSIAQIMVPDYENMDSDRPILDWDQLIHDGGCLYVGTNALGDRTVSSTFIQILLEEFSNHLGQRYQYGQDYGRLTPSKDKEGFLTNKVAFHIDEISAIRTKAVKNLLARVGEAGVLMRIYTQSHADMVYTFGSREDMESAIDNFGAILMHRVNNPNTADLLISRINQVGIEKEGRMYGSADSSSPETDEDFSSSNLQREDDEKTTLLAQQNITALPTGEAFILTSGQHVDKVRVPLVMPSAEGAPESIRDMIEVMKRNDEHRVQHDSFNDEWFQSTYPEFNHVEWDASDPDNQPQRVRGNFSREPLMPVQQVDMTMKAQVGAEDAAFSAQEDTLGG